MSAGQSRDKPLYRLVEDHLREKIRSGELIPGDLIPSEPQLAVFLGVSQGTAKKAIDNLVWESLLYRHQGKGTYVSAVDFGKSMFRFFSYGDARGRPIRIHKETPVRRLKRGPEKVRHKLNVPAGAELLYIERVGYLDDTPILVEYSWWPAELVPGLESEDVHIPDYLYALVMNRYQVPVIRAEDTLTAEAADAQTAKTLNIKPGTPIIVLKRYTYSSADRAIEVRTTKGRADKFSYTTEIR
jgi:GntR family transcriptional regulator